MQKDRKDKKWWDEKMFLGLKQGDFVWIVVLALVAALWIWSGAFHRLDVGLFGHRP